MQCMKSTEVCTNSKKSAASFLPIGQVTEQVNKNDTFSGHAL